MPRFVSQRASTPFTRVESLDATPSTKASDVPGPRARRLVAAIRRARITAYWLRPTARLIREALLALPARCHCLRAQQPSERSRRCPSHTELHRLWTTTSTRATPRGWHSLWRRSPARLGRQPDSCASRPRDRYLGPACGHQVVVQSWRVTPSAPHLRPPKSRTLTPVLPRS